MGMIIMNGKEYTSSPKDGFPPIIYSDEEREIGVWRDGKPLYQKTIFGTYSFNTDGDGTLYIGYVNSSDIDSNIDMGWFSQDMSYYIVSNTYFRGFVSGWYEKDIGKFTLMTKFSRSSVYCILTFYYTKTTDTPGSGKYTTYGGLSHHYSTSEQVVGTWINGKPLYERVFDLGSAVTISSSWTKVINDTNIIPIQCIGIYDTNAVSYPLTADSDNDGLYLKGDNVAINKFILQYTKTTD